MLPDLTKPKKGSALLASRARRAGRVAAEQKVMQEAKRRDGHQCRVPACEYRPKRLRIEAAHLVHRGMGGDPRGTRTTRAGLISLCVIHHAEFDAGQLTILPLTERGTDGPCSFTLEDTRFERTVGVPETRR